jgi:hypothetical protein
MVQLARRWDFVRNRNTIYKFGHGNTGHLHRIRLNLPGRILPCPGFNHGEHNTYCYCSFTNHLFGTDGHIVGFWCCILLMEYRIDQLFYHGVTGKYKCLYSYRK